MNHSNRLLKCLRFAASFIAMSAILLSSPAHAAYTWKTVQIGGCGATTSVKAHPLVPNLFFITSDVGNCYRWNNAAQRWEGLLNSLGPNYWAINACGNLAVDPSDATGNILYATLGRGAVQSWDVMGKVMKSTNRGDTWTDTGLAIWVGGNQDQSYGERIGVDPQNSNVVYVTTRAPQVAPTANGTFKSTNAGATWTQINSLYGNFLAYDVSGGTVSGVTKNIMIGCSDGVYRSTDGGATFTLMAGSPADARRAAIQGGTLYTTSGAGVYKWNGSAWSTISPATGGFTGVDVNPNNANEVIVGNYNGDHYRSNNGGTSWTLIVRAQDLTEIPFFPGNIGLSTMDFCWDPFNATHVWFTDFFNAHETMNVWASTVTWKARAMGHEELVTCGTLLCPPAGSNNLLFSSAADLGGFDHTSLTSPPAYCMAHFFPWNGTESGNMTGVAVQGNNPNFIVRVGRHGWNGTAYAGYSTDGGLNYTQFASPSPDSNGGGKVAVSATSTTMVWVMQSGDTYRSTNSGASWTLATGVPNSVIGGGWNVFSAGGMNPIAADKVNGSKFYIYNAGRLYRSTDGGATFAPTAAILPNTCNVCYATLETSPGTEGDIWFGAEGSGLYHSTDSGTSFTQISNVQSAKLMAVGKALGLTPAVYVFGTVNNIANGTFRSDDNGASWTNIDDPLVSPGGYLSMSADRNVYGRMFISAGGNGIFVAAPFTAGSVTNGSFETPALSPAAYQYNPTGGTWTFASNSGIANNGSGFNNPTAPDGVQVAFIQGISGVNGSISQPVTFSAGTFNISFQASERFVTGQSINVFIDSTLVGTISPTNTSGWVTYTTPNFPVTAGSHTVQLTGTAPSGDLTAFIDSVVITNVPSPPPAPTGLTAVAGNSQITLNWGLSDSATSYNVERSTVSGSGFTSVATGVASLTYTNTGLTNGTVYFFRVAAVNSIGTSGYSNVASATPAPQPPPAPANLTAYPGDTQVSLTWSAAAGATTYNVYRGTTLGGESGTAIATGIGATSYTNIGLTNGTTYYYTVKGVNAVGTGGASNETSAKPSAANGQIAGTGTAPVIDGTVDAVWSGATSYPMPNVTGAIPGGATNSGSWQALWDATNLYVLVSMQDSTVVANNDSIEIYVDGNNGKAGSYTSVDWQWLFTNGSATIQQYSGGVLGSNITGITKAEGALAGGWRLEVKIPWSTIGVNAFAGDVIGLDIAYNNYNVAGTRANKLFWFSTADNDWTNPSLFGTAKLMPAIVIPSAPSGLTATAGNTQVALNWTASTGATTYNVKRSTVTGSGYATVSSPAATSYTNTGLTNGTPYYYVVTAVNANGESANSIQASATPTAATQVPVANNSFETPYVGNGGAWYNTPGASWTFTGSSGIQGNGSGFTAPTAPDGVQTAFLQGNGGTLGSMSLPVNFTATGTYTISFLSAYRAYVGVNPIVVSVDGVQLGAAISPASSTTFALSTTSTFTISTTGNHTIALAVTDNTSDKTSFVELVTIASTLAPPSAPTGLTATPGNAQVALSWAASSGATSYNVKRSTVNGSGYAQVTNVATTSYTNTGLTNGTTYYFVVTALNAGGESANSAQATATPVAPPAAPTGLTATPGNAQVALSWTASSGATAYDVKRSTVSGSGYVTVSSPATTTYTNTGLTNGTTYYFVVAAKNAGGSSANSSQVSATPVAPPAAPTGLTATPGNAQVVLSWTASSGATAYDVKRSTVSGSGYVTVSSPATTSYTNTGLTNGTTYYYVVAAKNAGGSSANSAQASATPVAPPAAPTGLTATAGNAQVALSWTASSGATSYNVKRSTVNGSGYAQVTNVATTTYTNTGLTNGTTYYFVVTAVNAGGTSANSNQASATPVVPFVAPTGLTATPGNAQVALTWSASTGATSYNVKRSTVNGSGYATVASPTITSYTNTGLTNGVTYYYVVTAVNATGETANSVQASATPSSANHVAVANSSFETPFVGNGGVWYNTPSASWTFAGQSGIQSNGSPFTAPNAPDGTQTAFLQGNGGTLGSMSLVVNFPSTGTYSINFLTAYRTFGGVNPIKVTVDGVQVGGNISPAGTNFALVTTANFTIAATGNHTIALAATDNTADKSSFVEQVVITGP